MFHFDTSNNRKTRRSTRRRLSCEVLQERALMAADMGISLAADGVLNITGSRHDDVISVSYVEGQVMAVVGNEDGELMAEFFNREDVTELNIVGKRGDDVISNETDLNATIKGGKGIDTIFGGSGSDVIYGNRGADFLYGGDGEDEIHGGIEDEMDGEGGRDNHIFAPSSEQFHASGTAEGITWQSALETGVFLIQPSLFHSPSHPFTLQGDVTIAEGTTGGDNVEFHYRAGHAETNNYVDEDGYSYQAGVVVVEGGTTMQLGEDETLAVNTRIGTAGAGRSSDDRGNTSVGAGASAIEIDTTFSNDDATVRGGVTVGVGAGFRTHNNEQGIGMGADLGFVSFDVQVQPDVIAEPLSDFGSDIENISMDVDRGTRSLLRTASRFSLGAVDSVFSAVTGGGHWLHSQASDGANWAENAGSDGANWAENAGSDGANWAANTGRSGANAAENVGSSGANWASNQYRRSGVGRIF